MNFISLEIENGVATITLNRPDKYNSFVREMALNFQDCLDQCAHDDDVRCIVITGEGKAFCAGQDLVEATNAKDDGLKKIVAEHYNPIILRLRHIEKPIIAAVNGVAAGAGANIALACDIVIATDSAKFIQAFSKIGLIPDSGGTHVLPRLIGWQRASALMMTGDPVSAKDAEEMGMIYKSIPDNEFNEVAGKLAAKIAKMPTRGLGLTKRALNHSLNSKLSEQLDLEETLQFEASRTEDYSEGVQAFLEKRKPNFKGK